MEASASYHIAPQGPRDLSAQLTFWLRTHDFTALEQARPLASSLAAHWLGPQGERFQFDYA